MKFIAYGLNHVTAPLSVREKYALGPEKVREVLSRLKPLAPEAVFLSTCNRVEFYLATKKEEECLEAIRETLGRFHRLKPTEIKKYFYFYEGPEAFLHLFRVAASLDSMVVGESQILGQVKEAYQETREAGMTGAILNGVFHRAFGAAKRVRSQTEIARLPVSVSSVAVDLARKIFSNLSEHPVLLLGAGEMGELTAKYLVDAGVKEFFIANRTLDKAQAIAGKLGGKAIPYSEGLARLEEVDILVTSLGGGTPVLKRNDLEVVMKIRGRRSLFIIDIGVPRNVEPEVGDMEAVYLYNVDNLSAIVEANRGGRQKAVEEAEAILREEVDKLCAWLSSRELVPTIVRLREHFEGIRENELKKFFEKNKKLSEEDRKAVERLTHDMLGKLLHEPSVNLKEISNELDRFDYARMLNDVFLNTEHSKNDKD
jgi:glutamyl-tRNA reductase